MTKYILFASLMLLLFAGTECKKEPPVVPPDNPTDTTSSNFVLLRIDTLGGPFSTAQCVDIVDENNIWVGGSFSTAYSDSTGNLDSSFNVAHWDGSQWNYLRILMAGQPGWTGGHPGPAALQAIKVFDENHIIALSQYSSLAVWNGTDWHTEYIDSNAIHQMFARSPNEVYFVGQQGVVARWNGSSLEKMNSGTKVRLLDVWGDEKWIFATGEPLSGDDPSETAFTAYTSAWEVYNEYNLLDTNSRSLNQYVGGMRSVYRKSENSKLWLLGSSIVDNQVKQALYEISSLSPFRANLFFVVNQPIDALRVRGNSDNDLFIPGIISGQFYHFNGKRWSFIVPSLSFFVTYGFSVKGDIVVSVGDADAIGAKAIVVISKR